jgi:hypothetical protein
VEGNYSAASSVKLDDDLSGYADILPRHSTLYAGGVLYMLAQWWLARA